MKYHRWYWFFLFSKRRVYLTFEIWRIECHLESYIDGVAKLSSFACKPFKAFKLSVAIYVTFKMDNSKYYTTLPKKPFFDSRQKWRESIASVVCLIGTATNRTVIFPWNTGLFDTIAPVGGVFWKTNGPHEVFDFLLVIFWLERERECV